MARRRKSAAAMSGGGALSGLWSLIAWLTGVIVSLAVGFGLVNEVLTVPSLAPVLTVTAGWIVVVLAILGVLIKIIDKLGR